MARTLASQISRINELSTLEQGWLDGEYGSAITPEALATAHELAPRLREATTRQYVIFPTEAGGLTFEHMERKDHISVEIEVAPDGTCTLFVLNHQANTSRYFEGIGLEDSIRFARDPFSRDAIQEPLFHVSADSSGVVVESERGGERVRVEFSRDPSLKAWAREMASSEFTARVAHPAIRQALSGKSYRP